MRKEMMGDGKNEKVTKTGEADVERENGSGKNDKVTKIGEAGWGKRGRGTGRMIRWQRQGRRMRNMRMRDGDPVKVTKRQGNRMRKESMGDGKNENVKKTGEVDE
jgi:hypothetical protein